MNEYEVKLTENEKELLEMIRQSKDPTKALLIAVEIIASYLSQL